MWIPFRRRRKKKGEVSSFFLFLSASFARRMTEKDRRRKAEKKTIHFSFTLNDNHFPVHFSRLKIYQKLRVSEKKSV